jgi:hypothetical protein
MTSFTRREFLAQTGIGAALLGAGCNSWPGLRRDSVDLRGPIATGQTPQVAGLVNYLNENARKVQAIQCNKVQMDCKQGSQPIGLDGMLVCQKPRNFRLKAKVVGQPAVDIGSNDQEFWYWISKAEPPYVFHCSYDDLSRGTVRLALPFQPDMLVAALGIAEYDPNKQYELKVNPQNYELIEPITTPAGQPAQKVTVFNRFQAAGNRPQVTDYILRDKEGKTICSATVTEIQRDRDTGAVLPFDVKLIYPAERAEMKLRLYDVKVVTIDPDRGSRLFSRRDLANLQSYDLGRGQADGGLQQAGGG